MLTQRTLRVNRFSFSAWAGTQQRQRRLPHARRPESAPQTLQGGNFPPSRQGRCADLLGFRDEERGGRTNDLDFLCQPLLVGGRHGQQGADVGSLDDVARYFETL